MKVMFNLSLKLLIIMILKQDQYLFLKSKKHLEESSEWYLQGNAVLVKLWNQSWHFWHLQKYIIQLVIAWSFGLGLSSSIFKWVWRLTNSTCFFFGCIFVVPSSFLKRKDTATGAAILRDFFVKPIFRIKLQFAVAQGAPAVLFFY